MSPPSKNKETNRKTTTAQILEIRGKGNFPESVPLLFPLKKQTNQKQPGINPEAKRRLWIYPWLPSNTPKCKTTKRIWETGGQEVLVWERVFTWEECLILCCCLGGLT